MKNRESQKLTLGGMMAALVFVMTWVPKIPIPGGAGYVHLGDGMICLAAMLLGHGAVAAAALGSALADIAGGYAVYALPTLLIKGAMAAIVAKLYRPDRAHALAAFALGEAVMLPGYFAADALLYGFAAAWAGSAANAAQAAVSVALGMLLVPLTERLKKAMG